MQAKGKEMCVTNSQKMREEFPGGFWKSCSGEQGAQEREPQFEGELHPQEAAQTQERHLNNKYQ